MADRTLYMDLNGKIKRGFEKGQQWKWNSIGKEDTYLRGYIPLLTKAKAHPDYEKFNRLASQRV